MSPFSRTQDALLQMQRYGAADENVADALEALSEVNDDLAHDRSRECVLEGLAKVRAALDKIEKMNQGESS